MCIRRSRGKATPQQHDSLPTTNEHDAYNSNLPQPQSQQEEKGSGEVGQEASKVLKDTESGSKKSTAGAKDKAKKKAAVAQKKKEQNVSFMVTQKSVRSLKTNDRVKEIQREVEGCTLDAILSSETWRLSGVETRPHLHGCCTNKKKHKSEYY